MSLLIETIRLEDGVFKNLTYHQQRMNESLFSLFTKKEQNDLEGIVKSSGFPKKGLHKCRVIYDDRNFNVEFETYTIRPVNSLKILADDTISYPFKYRDRTSLNDLFRRRENCDDVLIVKNGEVTDCSYANILFKKGADWVTPSSYLLKGTMRQFLLDDGQLKIDQIQRKDIRKFDKFKLVNAMLGFESAEVDVSRIID
jgi:4-amino-4-deoxychorismate lyase